MRLISRNSPDNSSGMKSSGFCLILWTTKSDLFTWRFSVADIFFIGISLPILKEYSFELRKKPRFAIDSRNHSGFTLFQGMNFNIEYELEEDGRWIAEAPELPGVLAYGVTKAEAESRGETLALEVLSERAKFIEP